MLKPVHNRYCIPPPRGGHHCRPTPARPFYNRFLFFCSLNRNCHCITIPARPSLVSFFHFFIALRKSCSNVICNLGSWMNAITRLNLFLHPLIFYSNFQYLLHPQGKTGIPKGRVPLVLSGKDRTAA